MKRKFLEAESRLVVAWARGTLLDENIVKLISGYV